jgi:hypothetical protein
MQEARMMPTLEIIVHCYAEKITDFAALLTAQLSSIINHPPVNGHVVVSVCTTPTDRLTRSVASSFGQRAAHRHVLVNVLARSFTTDMLFRRAIARNMLAKSTSADLVWFADCDYMVGPRTLDAMLSVDCDTLWHPKKVLIHKSHQEGDEFISRIVPGLLVEGDLGRFDDHRVSIAIGGLQFVSGDVARARGYLDGTRWVKAVKPEGGFRDTQEDRVYRGSFERRQSFEIPGLMRLRHSKSAFESSESRLAQTAGK